MRHLPGFESIPLKTRLDEREVAVFSVNRHRFPGVDIHTRLVREYPFGEALAHVVGYVGRINPAERSLLAGDPHYRATRYIGKTGVEHSWEWTLHGFAGVEQVEVDARGRVVRTIDSTDPVPGADVTIGLDVGLQLHAHAALAGKVGAIVAVDPRDGTLLAFASAPSFDPNPLVHGIDRSSYAKLSGAGGPADVQPRPPRPVPPGFGRQGLSRLRRSRPVPGPRARPRVVRWAISSPGHLLRVPRLAGRRARAGRSRTWARRELRRVLLRARVQARDHPHSSVSHSLRVRAADRRGPSPRGSRPGSVTRVEARRPRPAVDGRRDDHFRHRPGLLAVHALAARDRDRHGRRPRGPPAAPCGDPGSRGTGWRRTCRRSVFPR